MVMANRLPVRQGIVGTVVVCGLLLSGCSQALPQRTDSTLPIGVITAIAPGGFPCAASKESLPELMKRQKVAADVDAPDDSFNNLADALMRTKSIMLHSKDLVKVLDKEPGILKVSVVEHHSGFAFPYMDEAAKGCWLADEALLH
jgi:hypothetical protein